MVVGFEPTFCFRRVMPAQHQRFHALLTASVEALGYELLGVEVSRGRGRSVVRLYIDGERGITLQDCERVSHQVSGVLDVEDPIEGRYQLEVSSPGADRPLFVPAHFERFKGHEVWVRMRVPLDGRRNFRGTLKGMREQDVTLDEAGTEWHLPLEQIGIARLVPNP